MTLRQRPLAEVTYEAINMLLREIDVVDTVRFFNQYTAGYGNYTGEREQLYPRPTSNIRGHHLRLGDDPGQRPDRPNRVEALPMTQRQQLHRAHQS